MKTIIRGIMLLIISISANAQTKSSVKAVEFDKSIRRKNVQLLDVRRPAEYNLGHIKGSILANWEEKAEFAKQTSHLDKDRPVYIYCRSGKRSSAAAEFLADQGFKNVVDLEGGILDWKLEGKELEGEPKQETALSTAQY